MKAAQKGDSTLRFNRSMSRITASGFANRLHPSVLHDQQEVDLPAYDRQSA